MFQYNRILKFIINVAVVIKHADAYMFTLNSFYNLNML